jgi:hypothetical protein
MTPPRERLIELLRRDILDLDLNHLLAVLPAAPIR